MDSALKSKLLEIDTPWPMCLYSRLSRRQSRQQNETAKSMAEKTEKYLAPLIGWNKFPEIAIDGMNGTGKSSLILSMRRAYTKVNRLIPQATSGSQYNFDCIKSMEYMMMSKMTNCENVCWDRCAYSNFIFYYVHQLMHLYRNEKMPKRYDDVLPHLNTLAISTNLLQSLSLMESVKHTPTIFFICTDLELIGEALKRRETANDVYNSKEHNYQMAQCHVYKYFGEILKYPTFDLVDVFNLGMTLGDFHFILKHHIDVVAKRDSAGKIKHSVESPDTQFMELLDNFIDKSNATETLIYDYSNK